MTQLCADDAIARLIYKPNLEYHNAMNGLIRYKPKYLTSKAFSWKLYNSIQLPFLLVKYAGVNNAAQVDLEVLRLIGTDLAKLSDSNCL